MRLAVADPTRGLPYSLGDMPTADGGSFLWEVEPLATRLALQMVEQIAETQTYKFLATILPPEKVAQFFKKRVKLEIFPVVRAGYVAQWHGKNGTPEGKHLVIWDDHRGLGPALQSVWPSTTEALILGKPRRLRTRLWSALRDLRQFYRRRRKNFGGVSSPNRDAELPPMPGPTIAVHYVEGIDLAARSDLFWLWGSRVDPKRVLIFFDNVRIPKLRKPIPETVLSEIEKQGMSWVWLGSGELERKNAPIWVPHDTDDSLLAQFRRRRLKPVGPLEEWVARESARFVRHVDYWLAFYHSFNVKIHLEFEIGPDRVLAQNIALDLAGGLRVGWQHSEILTGQAHALGYRSHHVHFAWNARGSSGAENRRNQIDSAVVSGFPYAGTWRIDAEVRRLRERLKAKGANFVIALFDNGIYRQEIYSKSMIQSLYTAFLQWVIEDAQIGVASKSKRADIIQQMPEIHGLMAEAEATGRWVNLTHTQSPEPSEAFLAADMSVGIGIASTVVEAAAAGGKGIHCDMPAMRDHPFYEWGYEKVVFDDIDRMMAALRRYKFDPASEPELGDFSHMMDQIDPFHDGRAGERVGSYIQTLVESFEAGLDRNAAMTAANERYATAWGADKVISPKLTSR